MIKQNGKESEKDRKEKKIKQNRKESEKDRKDDKKKESERNRITRENELPVTRDTN